MKSLFDTVCVSHIVSDFRLILFHLKFAADRRFNCSHKEPVSRLYFHSDSKAAAGWLRSPLCSAVRMSASLSLIAPAGFYSIDFKIDVLHRCKERELQPSSSPEAPRRGVHKIHCLLVNLGSAKCISHAAAFKLIISRDGMVWARSL